MKKVIAMILAVLLMIQALPAGIGETDAGQSRQNAGELPAASFHTVQFVAAGEEVATLFVVDGAAMTRLPRAPEIKGQSFEGWYCDGVEVDAQTPVLADMVVKAVYTAVCSVADGEIAAILAEETESGSMTAALRGADGFVLVLDTGFRRQSLDLADDVSLDGMLPKEIEVWAVAALPQGLEGELLAAYDIRLDENGQTYQPDADHPVDVTIRNVDIPEDGQVRVWHILDDGAQEEITDFSVEEDTVTFTAAGDSVYAVTKVILTKNVTTGDGLTYEITVAYDSAAGLPMEGTGLLVKELLPGDEGYDAYVDQSMDALNTTAKSLEFARVFDIRIINENDPDEVYEPTGPVEVSIRLIGQALEQYDNVGVVHFAEDGPQDGAAVSEISSSVEGEMVEFTADSFSVYVVAAYSVEKIIRTGDGNTYKITVSYGEDAMLPAEVDLAVAEITEEDEAFAAYRDQARARCIATMCFTCACSISLLWTRRTRPSTISPRPRWMCGWSC